jgi:hypothetical protein
VTLRAFGSVLLVLSAACGRLPDAGRPGIPPVRVAVTSGRAEHIVALGDSPEAASGSTLGIALNVAPTSWLELHGRSASGSLTAAENTRGNHDLAELEAGGSVLILPWLAAMASVEGRSYSGTLATQRWIALRTGAEARLELANGARGVIRGSFLPKVTVDGLASPTLAIGSATGIELRRKRFFASLLYSIDRFDFPASGGEKRSEQLSSLMLQAGWRFGR